MTSTNPRVHAPPGHSPDTCVAWDDQSRAHDPDGADDDARQVYVDAQATMNAGGTPAPDTVACLLHASYGNPHHALLPHAPDDVLVAQWDAHADEFDTHTPDRMAYLADNASAIAVELADRGHTVDPTVIAAMGRECVAAGRKPPYDLVAGLALHLTSLDIDLLAELTADMPMSGLTRLCERTDRDDVPTVVVEAVRGIAHGRRRAGRGARRQAAEWLGTADAYEALAADPHTPARTARWAAEQLADVDPERADAVEVVVGLVHGPDHAAGVRLVDHDTDLGSGVRVKTTKDGRWTVVTPGGGSWRVMHLPPQRFLDEVESTNGTAYPNVGPSIWPRVDAAARTLGATTVQTLHQARAHIGARAMA